MVDRWRFAIGIDHIHICAAAGCGDTINPLVHLTKITVRFCMHAVMQILWIEDQHKFRSNAMHR